ncbi:DoxX family protein [Antrihabitans cavernicola]|uniref:DoxX family protein n=1 Tax=Antrihabitans cavernicola TaxID=2495913 RepID=A0A5A7S7B9_9NOCA|nr:DoxX family protein [Spelaeibacter cavernicola]KAA0021394.1 DoxX family protein [Spelaeibacter cavernicola]
MNLTLWIIACLLAAVFALAGANKVFLPKATLAKAPGGGWVNDFSARFVKLLGVVEILGAVGLVVPAALDIVPVLVPLAAVGVAAIMVGAAVVTSRRREFVHVLVDLTYLGLAVFVAWGRFGPHAFV